MGCFLSELETENPENDRKEKIGRDAEQQSDNNFHTTSLDVLVEPGAHPQRHPFEQVANQDPEQVEQQFSQQLRHEGLVAPGSVEVHLPASRATRHKRRDTDSRVIGF